MVDGREDRDKEGEEGEGVRGAMWAAAKHEIGSTDKGGEKASREGRERGDEGPRHGRD